MNFYRVYHIDARGETAALHNFMALDDAFACERADQLMAASEWPGVELWENMRRVHCHGVTRLAGGLPDFPPSTAAAA